MFAKHAYQVFEENSNSFITILEDAQDENHPGSYLGFFPNLSEQQVMAPEFTLENGIPEIKVKQSSYLQFLETQKLAAQNNLNLQKQSLLNWVKQRRSQLLGIGKSDGVLWNGIVFDANFEAIENVKLKLISFIPTIYLEQNSGSLELLGMQFSIRWCIKNNHYHNFMDPIEFINFANEFIKQVDPVINAIFQSSFNHRDAINSFTTIEELNAYSQNIKADYFSNGN